MHYSTPAAANPPPTALRRMRICNKKSLLLLSLIAIAGGTFLAYSLLAENIQPMPKFMPSLDELLMPPATVTPSSISIAAHHQQIALISVLDRPELVVGEFQFALDTVRCYSLRYPHHYAHFVLLSPSPGNNSRQEEKGGGEKCAQNDFMFRRHCFVADWMETHPEFGWILFLDADIAVVNPQRKIEEFIGNDSSLELLFIDRLFNSEIAAGSYLTKNTPFARQFLDSWANFVLPNSFHGSDNGALHALFMERYSDEAHKNGCQHLWESSKNFGDLNVYEICVRHFIGKEMAANRTFSRGRVGILAKGMGWMRDGGHTRSRFALRRDFMLHGWKKSTFNKSAFNPWRNPFAPGQHFDDDQMCGEGGSEWAYAAEFVADEKTIGAELQKIIGRTEKEYLAMLKQLKLI